MARGIKTAFDLPPGRIIQAAPASFNVLGYDGKTTLFNPPLHFQLAGGQAAFNLTRQAATLVEASGGGASSIPGWPVTFALVGGAGQGTDYENATWRAWIKNFNLVCPTQYPGMEASMGMTFNFIMGDIKSRAAAAGNNYCKTGFYVINEEMYDPTVAPYITDLHTGMWNEAVARNWFLYAGGGAFPSGGYVIDAAYGTATLNMTDQTPVSSTSWSSGMNYAQASAYYDWNCLVNGTGSAVNQSNAFAANPNLDFIWRDNQWNLPRAGTGQYLCTSATQSNGNTTVGQDLQRGYAQNIAKMRSLAPSLLAGGNCDWLAQVTGPALYDPSCVGLYDLPYQESMFGFTYSAATFFAPATILAKMAVFEQLLSSNPNAIPTMSAAGIYPGAPFPTNQANWGSVLTSSQAVAGDNSNVVWSGNAWQGARMVLCFALLRGWAVYLDNQTNNYPPFLDEYNRSGAGFNWIKNWIDPPQLTPWSGTIYRRRAVEGIVYYNPPDGSTSQVVTATGHKLANNGFSDGSVNNGAAFTSFTMKAGDGLITLP